MGPTVWELEGPMPILKRSNTLIDITPPESFQLETRLTIRNKYRFFNVITSICTPYSVSQVAKLV
jgi:hypothetical protein